MGDDPVRPGHRRTNLIGAGHHRASLIGASALVVAVLQGCGASSPNEDLAHNLRPLLNARSIQRLECNAAGVDAQGGKLRQCNVLYTENGTGRSCVEILEVDGSDEPVTAPHTVRPCTPYPE